MESSCSQFRGPPVLPLFSAIQAGDWLQLSLRKKWVGNERKGSGSSSSFLAYPPPEAPPSRLPFSLTPSLCQPEGPDSYLTHSALCNSQVTEASSFCLLSGWLPWGQAFRSLLRVYVELIVFKEKLTIPSVRHSLLRGKCQTAKVILLSPHTEQQM